VRVLDENREHRHWARTQHQWCSRTRQRADFGIEAERSEVVDPGQCASRTQKNDHHGGTVRARRRSLPQI